MGAYKTGLPINTIPNRTPQAADYNIIGTFILDLTFFLFPYFTPFLFIKNSLFFSILLNAFQGLSL